MDSTEPYRELVKCIEHELGTLDSWDRRILDYWYVCGRQATQNAEGVDRHVTAGEWTAHVSILWHDVLTCYNLLWSDFLQYSLTDDETNVLIELALIVREVAGLTDSTQAAQLSEVELLHGGILPLMDIFYQWGKTRRLQAYLLTNAGFINHGALEAKRDELTRAIEQCLSS